MNIRYGDPSGLEGKQQTVLAHICWTSLQEAITEKGNNIQRQPRAKESGTAPENGIP